MAKAAPAFKSADMGSTTVRPFIPTVGTIDAEATACQTPMATSPPTLTRCISITARERLNTSRSKTTARSAKRAISGAIVAGLSAEKVINRGALENL